MTLGRPCGEYILLSDIRIPQSERSCYQRLRGWCKDASRARCKQMKCYGEDDEFPGVISSDVVEASADA